LVAKAAAAAALEAKKVRRVFIKSSLFGSTALFRR
jgi:hypothetical protein